MDMGWGKDGRFSLTLSEVFQGRCQLENFSRWWMRPWKRSWDEGNGRPDWSFICLSSLTLHLPRDGSTTKYLWIMIKSHIRQTKQRYDGNSNIFWYTNCLLTINLGVLVLLCIKYQFFPNNFTPGVPDLESSSTHIDDFSSARKCAQIGREAA